jgi:splicing factor 3A subunit 1
MKKVQWERIQRKNQDIRKQEEEAEKTAMSQIDWYDFAIVQTIEFDDSAEEVEGEGVSGPPGLVALPESSSKPSEQQQPKASERKGMPVERDESESERYWFIEFLLSFFF